MASHVDQERETLQKVNLRLTSSGDGLSKEMHVQPTYPYTTCNGMCIFYTGQVVTKDFGFPGISDLPKLLTTTAPQSTKSKPTESSFYKAALSKGCTFLI